MFFAFWLALSITCNREDATIQTGSDYAMDTSTSTNDEHQINKLMTRVFAAICFSKGSPPNIEQLRPLFSEQGLLVNYNGDNPIVMKVDSFIKDFESQWRKGLISGLDDREVRFENTIFNRVAHRISWYEARHSPDDKMPFANGINSIQLLKVDGDWKIISMAWRDEPPVDLHE